MVRPVCQASEGERGVGAYMEQDLGWLVPRSSGRQWADRRQQDVVLRGKAQARPSR
jgi:hypothetical protein